MVSKTTAGVMYIPGPEGSFSDEAAELLMKKENKKWRKDYKTDPASLISATANNGGDALGILPLVNSGRHVLGKILRSLSKHNLGIENIFKIEQRVNLMTLHSTKPEDVEHIASSDRLLQTSKPYLSLYYPGVHYIYYDCAPVAISDLTTGKLEVNTAVIGSNLAAEIYNLKIIAALGGNQGAQRVQYLVIKKEI